MVDAGGQLVAALRMDGNGYGIMDFALAKARASAAWGGATAGLAEGAREVPGFAAAPHVVTVAGGIPVFSADGRERIGAVGVSGEAPADDAACAEAGIAAAGLQVAPRRLNRLTACARHDYRGRGTREPVMKKIYPDAAAALDGLLSSTA